MAEVQKNIEAVLERILKASKPSCDLPYSVRQRGDPWGSGLGEDANEDSVKLLIVDSKASSVHSGTNSFLLDRE